MFSSGPSAGTQALVNQIDKTVYSYASDARGPEGMLDIVTDLNPSHPFHAPNEGRINRAQMALL